MRTLVTGGAGFIGSHLARRLVGQGEEVVVLDSLEGQVHGGADPSLAGGVTLVRGDVGDVEAVDRALAGVDRVVHLAAAVGVGQSMYEIDRYVRRNTMATATFLERVVAASPRPSRLVVASSMSIYGEGEYECPEHGRVAPGPRSESQLLARRWECRCPTCESVVAPVATRESKPLIPTSIYAITKRDHEELCLVTGRAYGIPTVGLRVFNVYGPGQSLANRTRALPPSWRPGFSTGTLRSSSRTAINRVTSSMSRTSSRAFCGRLCPSRRWTARSTSAAGGR